MKDESDPTLRNVLDAMERTHKRIFGLGWVTVVATLASYLWLAHVSRGTPDVARVMHVISAAVAALTCLITWCTFALAVVLTRMGRRILLAIELTATRPVGRQ